MTKIIVLLFVFVLISTAASPAATAKVSGSPAPASVMLVIYSINENTGSERGTIGDDFREIEIRFERSLTTQLKGGDTDPLWKAAIEEMRAAGLKPLVLVNTGGLISVPKDAPDCQILKESGKAAEIINRLLNKKSQKTELVLESATAVKDGQRYELKCER
jgi:hypothetical protein